MRVKRYFAPHLIHELLRCCATPLYKLIIKDAIFRSQLAKKLEFSVIVLRMALAERSLWFRFLQYENL